MKEYNITLTVDQLLTIGFALNEYRYLTEQRKTNAMEKISTATSDFLKEYYENQIELAETTKKQIDSAEQAIYAD